MPDVTRYLKQSKGCSSCCHLPPEIDQSFALTGSTCQQIACFLDATNLDATNNVTRSFIGNFGSKRAS